VQAGWCCCWWPTGQVQNLSSNRLSLLCSARALWELDRALLGRRSTKLTRNPHGTSHNSAYVHRRLRRRLGLRGAATRRSATQPLGPVGRGAGQIRAVRYETLRRDSSAQGYHSGCHSCAIVFVEMPQKAIRFGITDGGGHKSETWKLWSDPNSLEVYLACRALGGFLKASMHQSGAWHVAYTPRAYAQLVEGLVTPERGRFIERWPQPAPISPGVILAFRVVTPSSSVTLDITDRDRNVTWVPSCAPPNAIEADVFLISAGTPVTGWPGKRGMGSNLIGEFKLENGNSVWAVYRTIQMPDLSSLNTSVGGFFKGKGPSDLESDSLWGYCLCHRS
jgi:hypothetical protein